MLPNLSSTTSWTVGRVLRRARQVLREEGLKSLWFKVLGEIGYRRVTLFVREFEEHPVEIVTRVPVQLDRLQPGEIDDYLALRPEGDPDDIRRRLAAGQICFTARVAGRLVHVCWIATGRARIAYLAREIQLAPDEVYSYESFTAPEFRGSHVAPARGAYMQQTMRRSGYRRAVAVVVPENKPAYRAVEKAGFHRVGMLRTFWIGKWRRNFGRVANARSIDSAYWDGVAQQSRSRSHYLDPFLGDLKRQAHLDLIARWGGVPKSGRVLKTDLFEEAQGLDAFLWKLRDGANVVIGMDISPALAAAARQRDPDRRAHYLAADARHLPFAAETIDLIVSPSTLDHFVNPTDLGNSLRELQRTLGWSGQLIVTLDNRQNIFDPLLRLIDRLGLVPYFLGRSYSVSQLRAELAAADLNTVETTAILHNPRLVATAGVAIANRVGWQPLIRFVHRALIAAQRLEHTRWRYRTGSFIAARARRKRSPA
jgi:hypothetical protein